MISIFIICYTKEQSCYDKIAALHVKSYTYNLHVSFAQVEKK